MAAAVLVWTYATGGLMIDPVKEITIRTGRLAIAFLLLSLACTPIAVVTGYRRVLPARRPLGLWALAFAGAHFFTFAGLDYRFDLPLLWIGLAYQPFVIVGVVALLLMLILGVTSVSALRDSMGRAWLWVQRLVYLAGAMAVWHVLWSRKDPWEAWRYPVILGILLVVRVAPVRRAISGLRERMFLRKAE